MSNETKVQSITEKIAVTPNVKTYHSGTLTYTKGALAILFTWLIWGELSYMLMQWVIPNILPLKLKSLGCANSLMGVLMTTIPGILTMSMNPYISFKSDRYRSKWGRRIPFILWTLPFLCISLILLGCSDDISHLIQKNFALLQQFAPNTVTIALIVIFIIMFYFFNNFVVSVFWGLYNDVIPAQLMARFYGGLRVVNGIAASAINFFLFKYAESHMREIFIATSLFYVLGFGITCLRVKEGQYPPVKDEEDTKKKSGIKVYFDECFKDKFYWLIFLMQAFFIATLVSYTFNVFFLKDMGLSLNDIGRYTAIITIAALAFMYFIMSCIDRWHPVRVSAYWSVFATIWVFMNWVWVFVNLPGKLFFWLYLGNGLVNVFLLALSGAIQLPILVRLFPKSRFAQFFSAQGIITSLCGICAGVVIGVFLDFVKWCCNGSDFSYRFLFVWNTVAYIIVAITLILTYLYWYRLGGDRHYHPPAPWNKNNIEEMPVVPTVGPQSKWLNISLWLFNLIMAISTLGILPLMWWMYTNHAMSAFFWHITLLLPLSIAGWLCWLKVVKNIRRDMERSLKNEPLRNGIPHHGVLLLTGIQFLLAVGLWIAQIIITVNIEQEKSAIVFGVANVITNYLLIGAVWLFTKIERGHLITLDKALA
ncbi:MAG: hypothetical protein A2Y12_17630 [Planctomycetes bacterium GWF2_42_9]|nr:MAG: hypothetical protein A2Y12_17630 [Planctomycetes bacterium GWF2_42_9]